MLEREAVKLCTTPDVFASELYYRFCTEKTEENVILFVSAVASIPLGLVVQHLGSLAAWLECCGAFAVKAGLAQPEQVQGISLFVKSGLRLDQPVHLAEYTVNKWYYTQSAEDADTIRHIAEDNGQLGQWLKAHPRLAPIWAPVQEVFQ